jgi:hypothetical protein
MHNGFVNEMQLEQLITKAASLSVLRPNTLVLLWFARFIGQSDLGVCLYNQNVYNKFRQTL